MKAIAGHNPSGPEFKFLAYCDKDADVREGLLRDVQFSPKSCVFQDVPCMAGGSHLDFIKRDTRARKLKCTYIYII